MEVVAKHLRDYALELPPEIDADLFGRSAFNRFYYSAYLIARDRIKVNFPDFPKSHAGVPDFLRGTVSSEIAKQKNRARRAEDHQLMQQCSEARTAATNLADLLVLGYSARAVADYDPEILVDFSGSSGFRLNKIEVSEAESWPHKARTYTILILSVFK